MTQIIRFAIYVHKVGNADAKYHEIQFSNKCYCFCYFFIIIISCKYVFSKLDYFVNVVSVVRIWACHCN